MTEKSPLLEAQEKFSQAVPFVAMPAETVALSQALGRTLHGDLLAPEDAPPYHRAIVEGFAVNIADTQAASETNPVQFKIVGNVQPGDEQCPSFGKGEAVEVNTGSILPDGPIAIVRMWDCKREGNSFTITRPFPPRFFIEDRGCDIKQGSVVLTKGSVIEAKDIGTIASLGLDKVSVARQPRVTLFSSGDEVIAHTQPLKPGSIRDCNGPMLSAAVTAAGGIPQFGGIMGDDFAGFVAAVRNALKQSDMIVISGGTAVGGRDFISDLISEVGELLIDGVPMKSGRPLIMGIAAGKPIVAVAGHPPEALRGFRLFGVAAFDRLLGRTKPLPTEA